MSSPGGGTAPGARRCFFVHSAPLFPHRTPPLAVSLSKRVQKVKPSPTLAVTARAASSRPRARTSSAWARESRTSIRPPISPMRAWRRSARGFTRYTAVDGTAELKDAIIAKFKRENGLTYDRSQILVSSGAKQTCFNLCAALLDPGDECVIPAPYWVSYPDMVLLADGCRSSSLEARSKVIRSRRRSSMPPSRREPSCSFSTARAIQRAPPTRRRN